jgi:hypothetical protein
LKQEKIGMTAWLSNTDLSDQAQQARWNNIAIFYAVVAAVAALALLIVVGRDRPIPPDAAAYFIGP